MPRTFGLSTIAVLQAVSAGHGYGFDIIDATGLPSGTVYPALGRLEEAGLLSSGWEDARIAQDERRPPRRYYRMTPSGEAALVDAGERFRLLGRAIGRARARS